MSKALDRAHAYWRTNLKLLGFLLSGWFLAGFVLSIILVEPLNSFHMGGFPLGFWFAQQGAILVFVVLVLIYARSMDAIELRMASHASEDAAQDAAEAAAQASRAAAAAKPRKKGRK